MTTTICSLELPEIATKKQVAVALQISPQTVERLVKNGGLRAIKIGKLVRFKASDVQGLIEKSGA